MTFVVKTVTTITCDGSVNMPCPDAASAVHEQPQSVAIRVARKQGWLIGTDILCPVCSCAEVEAVPVSPWPLASMMVPAACESRIPVLHR
ncbi:MAG TPA: hypothetical protein VF885_21970 [Arthrobacter sp.]